MPYSTGDFPVMADGHAVGRVHIEQTGLMLVFDCICSYQSPDVLRLAAVCGGQYVPLGVLTPDADQLRLKKSFTKNVLASIGYDKAASYHLIRQGELYAEAAASVPADDIDEPSDAVSEPFVSEQEPELVLPAHESETVVYNDFPDPVDYAYDFASEPSAAAGDYASEPAHDAPDIKPSAVSGWMTISNPGVLFDDDTIQASCEGISNALITEQDGYTLLAVPVSAEEPFPLMPVFCFGSSGDIGGQACIIFKIKNGNLTL